MTQDASPVRGAHARIPADRLRAQIVAVLTALGVPDDLASPTAEVMVETDLCGVDSHGIAMLPTYAAQLLAGEVRATARPSVVRETGVSVIVDAAHSLGHPAALLGMRSAVSKARDAGVGLAIVRRSHHFGAAGPYARIAADAGMIGMVATTARTVSVVPTRSALPRLGTNPLALAAPAGPGRAPLLLDMSTSTVAVNKLRVHQRNRWPLPEGWVTDGQGRALTDPDVALDQIERRPDGGVTPLGGLASMGSHKGYGLAVAVQVLAGVLAGATFAPLRRVEDHDDIGHFFLAVDPTLFREDGGFEADLGTVIDTLHDTPPITPDLPVLVPGDPEAASHTDRSVHGIPVSEVLLERLRHVSQQCGAEFLLGPG